MIDKLTRARIVRLRLVELWPIATIAAEIGVHHSTVTRALHDGGVPDPARLTDGDAGAAVPPSKLDPFVPFILDELRNHPKLKASRLFAMCQQRGYDGRPDHFRHRIALLRPRRPPEAFLRLQTLPAEQAQCDWGHFGTVPVGRAIRKLYGFVMVLAYSRWIFLHFTFDIGMAGFVRGHVLAFAFFGGVARTVLYDNLKSAVLERVGDAIVFHPTLLALAGHYRFKPQPVAPARGNEKGRVERAIRYIRDNFFAGRTFADITDLNQQARQWSMDQAGSRKCPGDSTMTVAQAFEAEKPLLVALPAQPFADHERHEVRAGKTPYVRFDLNDYSVPHAYVQRQLTVLATETTVRIADGGQLLAEHSRSYDRDRQIENPAHIAALHDQKAKARQHRNQQVLFAAAPQARDLLVNLARQGANLGSAVAALLVLLDSYGAAALQAAIAHALLQPTAGTSTVRQFLESQRRNAGLPPLGLAVPLPSTTAPTTVVHKAATDYDQLAQIGANHHKE